VAGLERVGLEGGGFEGADVEADGIALAVEVV
jgi:hypothetical protein